MPALVGPSGRATALEPARLSAQSPAVAGRSIPWRGLVHP
jgi:hypothetical protein